jgi:MFS family permease
VLELCGPERTATYAAVAGLLIGPFRAAAPLVGAWLVGTAGYRSMFGGCAAVTLLALAVSLRWVMEPRKQVFRYSGVQVFGEVTDARTPEHLNT